MPNLEKQQHTLASSTVSRLGLINQFFDHLHDGYDAIFRLRWCSILRTPHTALVRCLRGRVWLLHQQAYARSILHSTCFIYPHDLSHSQSVNGCW
jgi:hypothetical protein